jgi:hypothetical protein
MKSKNTAVEYPDIQEVHDTITTLTSHRKEFESHTRQQPVSNKKIRKINSTVGHNKLKGLCGNCDFAETCIYFKPAAGIWHCNEYQ